MIWRRDERRRDHRRVVRRHQARAHDFILCNYANADMVGHTGVAPAVIRAVETVDQCLARLLRSGERPGHRS